MPNDAANKALSTEGMIWARAFKAWTPIDRRALSSGLTEDKDRPPSSAAIIVKGYVWNLQRTFNMAAAFGHLSRVEQLERPEETLCCA